MPNEGSITLTAAVNTGSTSYTAEANDGAVTMEIERATASPTWDEVREKPDTFPPEYPEGGSAGNVLKKTTTGVEWGAGTGAVSSVNGQTGTVVLDAEDVGALPSDTSYIAGVSVNDAPLTPVSKVVNIPLGTDSVYGVFRSDEDQGIKASVGILSVNCAAESDIAGRSSIYLPVSAKKINHAVKAALSDDYRIGQGSTSTNPWAVDALTDTEKGRACGVIGAVKEPSSEGTSGQVLTTDGSGGRSWATVSGGGAVDSVNGQTGVVVLDAEDVGALPDSTTIPSKTSDLTNDSGFLTGVKVNGTTLTPSSGAVDIPASDDAADTYGVVIGREDYGTFTSDGEIGIVQATSTEITNRSNAHKPVSAVNLNYAVKAALSDSKRIGQGSGSSAVAALTDSEKTNACGVIGAALASHTHAQSEVTGLVAALAAKGTYSKPSGGIPATDMTEAVQASLAKADAAMRVQKIADDFAAQYKLPKVTLTGTLPTEKLSDPLIVAFSIADSATSSISGYAEVNVQGSSSAAYPKKNYSLSLYSDAACTTAMSIEAMSGWGSHADYVLKANYVDHTHARNVAAAKLWGQMVKSRSTSCDSYVAFNSLQNGGAIDGFPVLVYNGSTYIGLYTFNLPKKPFLLGMTKNQHDVAIVGEKHDGITEFYYDSTEASFSGSDPSWDYVCKPSDVTDNDNSAVYNDLNELKTAVNMPVETAAQTAAARTAITAALDTESAIDYCILMDWMGIFDNYGKNMILAKKNLAQSSEGKWMLSAYDLDMAFGNDWASNFYGAKEEFTNAQGNLYIYTLSQLFLRTKQLFSTEYKERARYLYDNILNAENVGKLISKLLSNVPEALMEAEGLMYPGIDHLGDNGVEQIVNYVRDRVEYKLVFDGAQPAPIAPAYSSKSTYAAGDLCTYNADLYVCNTAISTAEAWTAAHWTVTNAAAQFNRMTSLVVTVTRQDSVTVANVTLTLRKGSASGAVYQTAVYSGQPVTFSVPYGFSYYLSVSTISGQFSPTASGTVLANTVAVSLIYQGVSSISSFADIKEKLDAGMDLTNIVGCSVSNTRGSDTISWVVTDYTDDTVTLFSEGFVRSSNVQFEPPQALGYFPSGLAAGDYSFTNGTDTYYFTTTAAVPAGGQIRATASEWYIYSSPNIYASTANGTVSTTAISGAVSLGTCGIELNHFDRVNVGSNNYGESLIHRWINSDALAWVVTPCVNKYSRGEFAPEDGGFLTGFDADELAAVDDTVWSCKANSVYEAPASVGGISTVGQPYTVTSKFALCQYADIGLNGTANWELFEDAENADRVKKRGSTATQWWVRDNDSGYSALEKYVNTDGSGAISGNANGWRSIAVACKISKSV